MLRCAPALAGALVALLAGSACHANGVVEMPMSGRVLAVERYDGRALVRTDGGGRVWLVSGPDGGVSISQPPTSPRRIVALAGLLPQSEGTEGTGEIRWAWFSDATDRYRHGVLGDRLEAGTLRVRLRNGAEHVLEAGDDAVFEDLDPRLADLDGDGRAEIIVVKSYLARGAALAVVGFGADGLEMLDETPPIGRPNRWLNPVGAADFDGDGLVEIAYVETPHIGGRLMISEWRDGRLYRKHTAPGFSNHAIGSAELGLSAVVDVDGDGLMDLAVPGRHRNRLRLISLAGGTLRELADVALDGRVATAVAPVGDHLVFGLGDGRLMMLRLNTP